MKTVSKSALKARMLAYFREVERTGEPLEVTDRGRPVLRVVPIGPRRTIEALQDKYAGAVSERGLEVLLEPMDPEDVQLAHDRLLSEGS